MPSKNKSGRWQYVVSAFGALVLGIVMQWGNTFADPDSFYHVQITWQMLQHGMVYQFPWLYYTDLAQQFTDQHLLYHLLMAPWLYIVSPMVGAKIFQVVLIVALALFFHLWLRRWKTPYALVALFVLFGITPFCIRMNLVKASTLAVLCCYAILWCLLERKLIWAAVLTLIYTWIHAGFILAVICAGAVWLADSIVLSVQRKTFRLASVRTLIIIVTVCAAGVIVSPYFPYNLGFLWQQLVQIGILNYAATIEVGAEWYSFPATELIAVESVLLIGVVSTIVVSVWQWRKYTVDRTYWTLVILSVAFGVITLRSRRYVEYLTPILWLWGCYILLPYLTSQPWQELRRKLKLDLGWLYTALVIYFSVTIPFTVGKSYALAYGDLHNDQASPIEKWGAASAYIAQHSQPHAIVFNGMWDQFPELYFHNPNNYYIIGLDPTFMFLHDRDVFQKWLDISAGKSKNNTAKDIIGIFHAQYVVIDPKADRTKLLEAYLLRDPKVDEVFKDDDSLVFYIHQ